MIEIEQKTNSEVRFLTPPKVELKSHKKYCRFKKMNIKYVDYKDPDFLMRFLNSQGKILPRRITGNSLKFQRKIAVAVKSGKSDAIIFIDLESNKKDIKRFTIKDIFRQNFVFQIFIQL